MCAKAVEDTTIDWPSTLLTLYKRGYKELANHVMRSAPSVTDCLLSTEVNKIRLRIAGRSEINSEELCNFLEQAFEAVTFSVDLNELAGELGRFANGSPSESFQLGLLRAVSSRADLRSLRVALQSKNRDDSFRGSK